MKKRILGLICFAVLCTILTLGLWPFHAPPNDVTWLKHQSGLAFGRFSTMITSGAFPMPASAEEPGFSLEIWLQPRSIWTSGTFLGFCIPGNPFQLIVRQSQTGIEIQSDRYDRYHKRTARLYVDDVFRKAKPAFITIISGLQGTRVYVDGVLAKSTPQFRLSAKDLTGQLVVGDSPGQGDSWSGNFFGLAMYHRELKAPQVARHYETWTLKGRPEIAGNERDVALYLLDDRIGNVAKNKAGSGLDLYIPERYVVLDQIFLEPFWQEFSMSWNYWGAAFKNIVGFIPFGFCFYAYFVTLPIKRAAFATVILGALVSLTIEVLQAYLPTRDSGMTDLFTNTLGTWIGVASYELVGPILAIVVRWWPFVIPSRPPELRNQKRNR